MNVEQQRFRVTHPFHPWFGREFGLVTYRLNWGEERVYFHDDAGRLVALPARWTSVFPADPFVVLSAERSPFRFAQLQELARLIQQIRPDAKSQLLREHGTLNPRPQLVSDGLFQDSEFFDPHDLLLVKYEMLRRVRLEELTRISREFGNLWAPWGI